MNNLLLYFLLFSLSYSVFSQDLSGHWHMIELEPKNGKTLNAEYYTIDIYKNRVAFFNQLQLDYPDKQLYEAFKRSNYKADFSNYQTKNIFEKLKLIRPFSWGHGLGIPHLELYLRRAGQLRVSYVNASRFSFLEKLPPFADNSCRDFFHDYSSYCENQTHFDSQYLSTIPWLSSGHLTAEWNPVISKVNWEQFAQEEDFPLVNIQLLKNGEVLINNENIPMYSIKAACYDYLVSTEKATKLAFRLEAHPRCSYKNYLNAYLQIKQAYEMIWDKCSIELYGKPYSISQSPIQEQQEIKTKYPYVLIRW